MFKRKHPQKLRLFFLLLAILTTASGPPPDSQNNQVRIPDPETLQNLFHPYQTDSEPGCATAVYQQGTLATHTAIGLANLDYAIPLSDSTAFYMASVSKQVTAAAAGLLIVRGQLDPDALVSNYLDHWPQWAAAVTVSRLFDHTSGLPDLYALMHMAGIAINNPMDTDDYLSVIYRGESLTHRPGARYSYTNSGYTVLVKLIETITETDFSVFVQRELFEPLGMHQSTFHNNRYRIIANRALSYAPTTDSTTPQTTPPSTSQAFPPRTGGPEQPPFRLRYPGNFQGVGPGGLYSTLQDWQHWEAFWNGSNVPDPEYESLRTLLLERLASGVRTRNGEGLYGWGLERHIWQGLETHMHQGSFMGFRSHQMRFPQQQVALLTLCNREDADPYVWNQRLARHILESLFGAYLRDYTGIYENSELQVRYEVRVENSELILDRRLPPQGRLTEIAPDRWEIGSMDIVFQRDASGTVTGLTVTMDRAQNVHFRRVQMDVLVE